MIHLNIISEGSTEEAFVNNVLRSHFASMGIYVNTRKILTGWNKFDRRPAKGGLLKYAHFKNDVCRWIDSDNGKPNTYYTSMVDLYQFPRNKESPYKREIQQISAPFLKVRTLEDAIGRDIDHPYFIPYVQLHEFEALLLADPEKLLVLYPDKKNKVDKLKKEISGMHPEEINEKPETAPSKRIIRYIPEYEGQKAQVAPLVAEDIGLFRLRERCDHFNEWITKLEKLAATD
jgi:hypothetical protein